MNRSLAETELAGSGAEARPAAEDTRRGDTPLYLAAALLAGATLRLLFLWRFPHVTGDALTYGDLARNLIAHHVYGFTQTAAAAPRLTLIRLPGYPFFLAVCFALFGVGNYTAVLYVQVVADLGTCVLLGATARALFGERAGWAALWLSVLCPFTANYVAAPLTETLTLFTIALAFFALVRWQAGSGGRSWLWVLGGALASSILLRPEQGLLAAAVLPAVALLAQPPEPPGRRIFGPVLLVLLVTLAPLAPWAARNWAVFHVFQPLAPRQANDPGELNPYGFERWYRTWALDYASTEQVYWKFNDEPIVLGDLPPRAFDNGGEFAETAALLESYNETDSWTPELDRRFDAVARQRIAADPLEAYVLLPVGRLVDMTLRPRTEMLPVPLEWWRPGAHPGPSAFALGYALLNLLYLIAGVAGLRVGWQRAGSEHRVILTSMAATIVLRGLLLLTLDNSEPRYTLEFFPVVIMFAAALWAGIAPTFRRASL